MRITAFCKRYAFPLLLICIFLTCLAVYSQYVFGGWAFMFNDMGSDTMHQYVMQYAGIANHLREGSFSLWDMTNGFGTSMYQLELFNPALWIAYLCGAALGPQAVPGSLIWVHIVMIVLAGAACYGFLKRFSFHPAIIWIVSYIYAFNAFQTVWGQHYFFNTAGVLFPLLLLFTERAIDRGKGAFRYSPALTLISGLAVLSSYYFGYMSLIAATLFIFFRLIWLGRRPKQVIGQTLLHGLSMVLGVGIAGIALLPSLNILFNVSARASSDMSLVQRCIHALHPESLSYYRGTLLRLFSSNTMGYDFVIGDSYFGNNLNYYELPCLFFSALLPVSIPQYIAVLLSKKQAMPGRQRAVGITCVLISAFMLLVPLGGLIFNAFVAPFSRWTFLLMPFFALLCASVLSRILHDKVFSIPAAIISALAFIGVFALGFREAPMRRFQLGLLLITVCGICLIIIFAWLNRQKAAKPAARTSVKTVLLSLAALLIIASVAGETLLTAWGRGVVRSDSAYYEELYGEDIRALLESSGDGSLYRMEKDYFTGSSCMEALAQGYYGISTYNSTANANIIEFAEELVPEFHYSDINHFSFRQLTGRTTLSALLGVRYLVAKDDALPWDGWQQAAQYGDLYLYENTSYEDFASFFADSDTIDEGSWQALSNDRSIAVDELLADYLIIDDAASNNISENYAFAEFDSGMDETTGCTGGNASIQFTMPDLIDMNCEGAVLSFTLRHYATQEITIQVNGGEPYTVTEVTPGIPLYFTIPVEDSAAGLGTLNIIWDSAETPVFVENVRLLGIPVTPDDDAAAIGSEADIEVPDSGNESLIECSVSTDTDGYVFIPVAYEDGWTAQVDGYDAEIVRADIGFMAVHVNSGSHEVRLMYTQPLLREGVVLSLGSLALTVLLAFVSRRKNSRTGSSGR